MEDCSCCETSRWASDVTWLVLETPACKSCLTCPSFLTTVEFLPQHQEQLDRTEQLIAQAEADGRQRLVDMNTPVRINLLRIIDGLQTLETELSRGD